MDKQAKALANLAPIRDRAVVFHSVRAVLGDTLTDAGKLASISDLYAAFDDAHPEAGGEQG